jgi:hypothetical protein
MPEPFDLAGWNCGLGSGGLVPDAACHTLTRALSLWH